MTAKRRKSALQRQKDNPRSKYWRNKADAVWGRVVRRKERCEKCQHTGRVDAHHLIRRGNGTTRHTLENGIALCASCHKFGRGSAHGDPVVFAQWLSHMYPDRYQWVSENKWVEGKTDYRAAYERLKAIEELL